MPDDYKWLRRQEDRPWTALCVCMERTQMVTWTGMFFENIVLGLYAWKEYNGYVDRETVCENFLLY